MAIVVFNPTNEKFTATYIGETCEIEARQKIRYDDARARHLLNILGPRGLVSLEYGDEGETEERKAREGIARNKEFKRHQVLRYNQQNEAHKQQGLPYVPVSAQVKEYAAELGLVLVQPYQYKDKETEEIAQLRDDKDSQKQYIEKLEETNKANAETIHGLQKQVKELVDLMKSSGSTEKAADATGSKEAKKVELGKIRDELGFVRLPIAHFENWVARRWDDIQKAPPEIQAEIEEKFKRFYNKPFPTEQPEVQDSAA